MPKIRPLKASDDELRAKFAVLQSRSDVAAMLEVELRLQQYNKEARGLSIGPVLVPRPESSTPQPYPHQSEVRLFIGGSLALLLEIFREPRGVNETKADRRLWWSFEVDDADELVADLQLEVADAGRR